MQPLQIDQLIFKGTHNSYACKIGSNDPPVMNHPPEKQMDEFGVWALELDIGVKVVNGLPTVLVGHDEPGDATCFIVQPFALAAMLQIIADSAALQFRPVFIFFDIKTDWTDLDRDSTFALAIADVNRVFAGKAIDLAKFVEQNRRYPTVPEIAGSAVVYFPGKAVGMLQGTHADHCTSGAVVEQSIATGQPVEGDDPNESYSPGSGRVFRLDQYQADWTFDYGVPPNPLVVDFSSELPRTVSDAGGDNWFCGDPFDQLSERGQFQVVQEAHGTYAFPYKTVQQAVDRAKGIIPGGTPDNRRSGFGWTVLIRPGLYPEALTVDIPLILKNDDRFTGPVVLGR